MKFRKLYLILILSCHLLFIHADVVGSLNQIPGSPFASEAGPVSFAYSSFESGILFAAVPNYGNNTISVYTVNQMTGALAPVIGSSFATGNSPICQAYSPLASGNLFSAVANFNDNTMSVYAVNQATGAFTQVAGSPFATGAGPISVEFSPIVAGNLFVVIANSSDNTVSVYEVNQASGACSPVAGSPFATGSTPFQATFSPLVLGNLFAVVVNSTSNSLSVYEVNQATGTFTAIVGSPFATGASPHSVKFSPLFSENLFAAVTNSLGGNISVYAVHQTTGTLNEIFGSPFAAGNAPYEVAFSPIISGTLFAAATNHTSNDISLYEVDQTGAFTQVAGSPFATGGAPVGIAFSPDLAGNLFAATANAADATVSVFQVSLPTFPTVTNLLPSSGTVCGGTSVTITGLNFTGAIAVDFGEHAAASFTVDSDSQITAISPPGTGSVEVIVMTANKAYVSGAPHLFTYLPPTMPLPLPMPPSKPRGFQQINRFLNRTACSNILKWRPPAEGPPIVSYKIFRDRLNHLVGEVPGHGRLEFIDENRKREKTYTYYIVSMDECRNLSKPIKIVVNGK